MKLVLATTAAANDMSHWSGTPFFMAQAFSEAGVNLAWVGDLTCQIPLSFKLMKLWKSIACRQRESPRFSVAVAKNYSLQLAARLPSIHYDAILSPLINPIAYLETRQPIILWTDGLPASSFAFYPGFAKLSMSMIKQGDTLAAECLRRCRLTLFSSDWAARTAIEMYGVAKEKVHVVPFGANLSEAPTLSMMHDILKTRPCDRVKLLFLGSQWKRKGGDVVLNVAKALHDAGFAVEVNLVGCNPPQGSVIPDYVICHGFVSKYTKEGRFKIKQLLSESHFLFVPSCAEAYGVVFCEASAFGLPVLTTYVGGIGTIVKDNINGLTFALDAPVTAYCKAIVELMEDRRRYEALALSAFHEYQTRLNWRTAVTTAKNLIAAVL